MKKVVIGIIIGAILVLLPQYLRTIHHANLFLGTAAQCSDAALSYVRTVYWNTETWHFDFYWRCKEGKDGKLNILNQT